MGADGNARPTRGDSTHCDGLNPIGVGVQDPLDNMLTVARLGAMKPISIRKVLKVVDRWDFLRWFGRSRWVATSYVWLVIVPTAAKLLRYVEDEYEIVATWLSKPLRIDVNLPFNWYVFFATATCFAVAQVVYWMRCPKIVKEHGDYGTYRAAYGGSLGLRNYIHDVFSELGENQKEDIRVQLERETRESRVREWTLGQVPKPDSELPGDKRVIGLNYAIQMIKEEAFTSAVFLIVRDHASTLRPWTRRLCGILFLIGALAFLFVLAQSFWFVIRLPFK